MNPIVPNVAPVAKPNMPSNTSSWFNSNATKAVIANIPRSLNPGPEQKTVLPASTWNIDPTTRVITIRSANPQIVAKQAASSALVANKQQLVYNFNITSKLISQVFMQANVPPNEDGTVQSQREDTYLNRMVGCPAPVAKAPESKRLLPRSQFHPITTQASQVKKISDENFSPINHVNLTGEKMAVEMNNFYNPAAMSAALCAMNSILYIKPRQLGELHINDRIRRWLSKLAVVASGVNGQAMTANFTTFNDAFILKAPKEGHSNNLSHEVFVGLYGTNKLRAYCPNFAYVFGAFKCSPPLFDDDKSLSSWCTSADRNGVTYAVYENIDPNISMNDYLIDCSVKEFVVLFLQIIYALLIAQHHSDFTHYDLHPGNVVVRLVPVDRDFEIKYTLPTDTVYMRTRVIGTIIDYGFTHVTVDDKHFGEDGFRKYFIYNNLSSPLYDVYKLLMYSANKAAEKKNNAVYETCRRILTFFNKSETLEEVIERQLPLHFAFPRLNDLTLLKQFADFFQRQFGNELSGVVYGQSDGKIAHYYCNEKTVCSTYNQSLDNLGLLSEPQPQRYFDFYDTWYTLMSEGRKAEAKVVEDNFRLIYDKATESINNHIIADIQSIGEKINELQEIKLTPFLPPSTSFPGLAPAYPSDEVMTETKELIISLANIEDEISSLRAMQIIIREINVILGKDFDLQFLRDFITKVTGELKSYQSFRNKQSRTMYLWLTDAGARAHFEGNKLFEWYDTAGRSFGFGIPQ